MDKRLLNKSWRLQHLYRIKDKDGNLVTFKMNRAQAEFNKAKAHRNIILKSRQLGFTTLEVIDTLDDALFTRNFDSLFVAQDLDTAKDIFANKVNLAWKNIPEELQSLWIVESDSARKLKFGFGDNTESSITVDNTGRSGTFRRVHISELPILHDTYPDRAREVMEGTIPAIPLDGRLDIEGTAKGEKGSFYDIFTEAIERGDPEFQTQYKAHFYNWTYDDKEIAKVTVPRTDLPKRFKEIQKRYNLTDLQITYYYYKWESLGKDWDTLLQEYPTTWEEAFVYAGDKFFAYEQLENQKAMLESGNKEGNWTYYKDYKQGHNYGMGADIGEGVGRDSSCAVIWDFSLKPEVVATYQSDRIQPNDFAYELRAGAIKYGNCIVAPENNNIGYATVSKLREIYNNIYKEEKLDKTTGRTLKKYGWKTSLSSKPKMFYDFKTAVNDDEVKVISKVLYADMRAYSQDELSQVKEDEEATRHFDMLMAAVIGFQMRTHAGSKKISQYIPNYG